MPVDFPFTDEELADTELEDYAADPEFRVGPPAQAPVEFPSGYDFPGYVRAGGVRPPDFWQDEYTGAPSATEVARATAMPHVPTTNIMQEGLAPLHKLALTPEEVEAGMEKVFSPFLSEQDRRALMEAPLTPSPLAKATAGLTQGGYQFAESLTSPANLALMATAPLTGGSPLVGRLMAGGFAGQMLGDVPEAAQELGRAYESGDPEAIARAGVNLAALGATTVGTGLHAVGPRVPMPEMTRALAEMEGGDLRAQEERSQAQRDVLAETGEAPSLPTTETPDAIQERQAAEVLRNVPGEPTSRAGGVPAEEGAERVPQGGVPPGDEGGAPRAEEAGKPEVPLDRNLAAQIGYDLINRGTPDYHLSSLRVSGEEIAKKYNVPIEVVNSVRRIVEDRLRQVDPEGRNVSDKQAHLEAVKDIQDGFQDKALQNIVVRRQVPKATGKLTKTEFGPASEVDANLVLEMKENGAIGRTEWENYAERLAPEAKTDAERAKAIAEAYKNTPGELGNVALKIESFARVTGPGKAITLPEERFQREEGAPPLLPEMQGKSFGEVVDAYAALPDASSTVGYKGKHGQNQTGLAWDIGSMAKTPEDVAKLKQMAEKSREESTELMKKGDFEGAMKAAAKQSAEAYEFATGQTLDGKAKWQVLEKFSPDYKPSVPGELYKAAHPETKITEASPFEHKDYVTTDASGGAVLDLEKFGKALDEGKIKGGEAANQLLSHLLKPDENHPLSRIKVIDMTPAEYAAITGSRRYKGRFVLPRDTREGEITILTRQEGGGRVNHADFVQTLNHELTHNAVDSKFDSAPEHIKQAWREAYEQAKNAAKGTDLENHNAFSNDREFLAEASSSPRIQSFLAGQLKEGAKGPLTLKNSKWGQVLDTMRRILKLPEFLKAKGKSVDTITLLDETMRLSGELEQVRREAKAPEERFSKEEREGRRTLPMAPRASEAGAVNLAALAPHVRAVGEFIQDIPGQSKVVQGQLAGKAVPATSSISPESGNKLVRYASAKIAAPEVAKSMATDVLGPNHYKDHDFGNKLGAVLVEDRLRAIRDAFTRAGDPVAAGNVSTILGQEGSPLRSEADFNAALADPEIQAAIQRHKQTVQPTAQMMHEETGGKLAGPGANTGAFVNLKAILPDLPEEVLLTGGSRGNLQNPLKRPSKFFKEAKGTAPHYEIDYRTLAQRMIEGNFEEHTKRQMYDQLKRDNLAQELDPDEPAPEFRGKKGVKFQVERRGLPAGPDKARTYIKNLWVDPRIAGEVRQALNVDGPVQKAALVQAANVINKIQLAGPTDAVWHTANMLGSIAGSQGGRTLLTDIARQLPGVNIADAVGRVVKGGIEVLRDTPEVQRELAELARIGSLRATEATGPLSFNRRMISFVDRAGRLVRNRMFDNLVERGLAENTEANRREFVNQMGQYNPRLMGQFQRFFKEAGFSPFIVAGRNFNRMAMRRLTLDPGVKAASPAAALQMRGVNAIGTVATLFAVPALFNYMLTGSPAGRPGTKMGQIDTGRDNDQGKHIVIDPAQWTGLRRGLRISGIQALTEGLSQGKRGKQIVGDVSRDVIGGIIHPWTGPAVTAASVARTGYTPAMYKESEDPNDIGENVKAALKQLNPVAKAIIESHETKEKTGTGGGVGGAVTSVAKSLAGAAGVKEVKPFTAYDQLRNLHQKWLASNKDPQVKANFELRQKEHFASHYADLDKALASGNKQAIATTLEKLRQSVKDQDIIKRMLPVEGTDLDRPKPLFQGSPAMEGKFLRSLSPEERELYNKARADRMAQWRLFLEVWRKRGPRATPQD